MSVSFRDITQDNFWDCINLKVREDQKFVASNAFSIAQSKIFPFWITKAVYFDENIVGFVMYRVDYEHEEIYLCRFMIDEKYQGRGYGKASLDIIRDLAMNDEKIKKIRLSTNPKNTNAIRIYEKYGFIDTNKIEDNEEVFVLDLRKE